MSRLTRRRVQDEEETDINLVPIMNMFLVLIPFLLMSVSFYHMKAINTSVPVMGESTQSSSKKDDVKITVLAEIRNDSIHLSAHSTSYESEAISTWEHRIGQENQEDYPFEQMIVLLEEMKERYPSSDTLIIIPDKEVVYETIIQVMDAARFDHNKLALFPNVVISERTG